MYQLKKRLEISACHSLECNYATPCSNLHGHNWIITIVCEAEELNKNGMVIDFADIKAIVKTLDHGNINDHVAQPTAENIARWLCDKIPHCVSVTVQETEGNEATWTRSK